MNLIELKKIRKSYQQGNVKIEALAETNFSSKGGKFIAIIGPSGSGKSTFLTIAGGLQTSDAGEVIIGGKDFSKVKEKERSKLRLDKIGFILQASNLIPFLQVIDQLKLHDKVKKQSFQQDKAMKILEKLEIKDLAYKYPAELSGGERQRVAIARAVYHEPDLVLADEPTASLDSKKAHKVVRLLAKLAKDLDSCIMMVTHDQRMIAYCDEVYLMEDGHLKKKADHAKTKD